MADSGNDAIWGFTNGARDPSKDLSQALLRSAAPDINPTGIAWDGTSVLVADSQNETIWGFTNGARDPSKDYYTSVIQVQGLAREIFLTGLTWDGKVLLLLDTANSVAIATYNLY